MSNPRTPEQDGAQAVPQIATETPSRLRGALTLPNLLRVGGAITVFGGSALQALRSNDMLQVDLNTGDLAVVAEGLTPTERAVQEGFADIMILPSTSTPEPRAFARAQVGSLRVGPGAAFIEANSSFPDLAPAPEFAALPKDHNPNLAPYFMNYKTTDCQDSPTRVMSKMAKLKEFAGNLLTVIATPIDFLIPRPAYAEPLQEALQAIEKPEDLLKCIVNIEGERAFLSSKEQAAKRGFTPIKVDKLKNEDVLGFKSHEDWKKELLPELKKKNPNFTEADVSRILANLKFTYRNPADNSIGVFSPIWYGDKAKAEEAKKTAPASRWEGEVLAVFYDPETQQLVVVEANQDLDAKCDNVSVPMGKIVPPRVSQAPVPPTGTPVPATPTETALPTATNTLVAATNTPWPSTNQVPPTATPVFVPPTPTNRPPEATPVPTTAPTAVPTAEVTIVPQPAQPTPGEIRPTQTARPVATEAGTPSVHASPTIEVQAAQATPAIVRPQQTARPVAGEQGTPSDAYVDPTKPRPGIPNPRTVPSVAPAAPAKPAGSVPVTGSAAKTEAGSSLAPGKKAEPAKSAGSAPVVKQSAPAKAAPVAPSAGMAPSAPVKK